MIIVYQCYGGTHSSVSAAYIHLNLLSSNPQGEDLLAMPLFDRLTTADFGRLFYHGEDEWGNKIYSMGRGKDAKVINNYTESLRKFHLIDDIAFIDTLPYVNIKMRLGGFFSRYLGLTVIGRPLCVAGTLEILPLIRDLVEKVKDKYGYKR